MKILKLLNLLIFILTAPAAIQCMNQARQIVAKVAQVVPYSKFSRLTMNASRTHIKPIAKSLCKNLLISYGAWMAGVAAHGFGHALANKYLEGKPVHITLGTCDASTADGISLPGITIVSLKPLVDVECLDDKDNQKKACLTGNVLATALAAAICYKIPFKHYPIAKIVSGLSVIYQLLQYPIKLYVQK